MKKIKRIWNEYIYKFIQQETKLEPFTLFCTFWNIFIFFYSFLLFYLGKWGFGLWMLFCFSFSFYGRFKLFTLRLRNEEIDKRMKKVINDYEEHYNSLSLEEKIEITEGSISALENFLIREDDSFIKKILEEEKKELKELKEEQKKQKCL